MIDWHDALCIALLPGIPPYLSMSNFLDKLKQFASVKEGSLDLLNVQAKAAHPDVFLDKKK